MMLFRAAKNTDLDAIFELVQHSGIGITTLPKDRSVLKKRLQRSSQSFKKPPQSPGNDYYFFVLEDPKNKAIVGTSAIEASTGYETPFYSYKLSKRTRICHSLGIRSDYEVLSLVNDHQSCTEICTLYLDPAYRRNHNGLLLSKSRFLFMAQYPLRFTARVIAELRGISDEEGVSPFWENVGRHFFQMSYPEADRLTLASNKQFIADLMPRNPVYVKLLSQKAQDVIGKPHGSTIPAMKILLKEGFRYSQYVDIFDAGPTLEAPIEKIVTFAQSHIKRIKSISDEVSSAPYLLANPKSGFRATLAAALINEHDDSCIINKDTATLLKVGLNDALRISLLFPGGIL